MTRPVAVVALLVAVGGIGGIGGAPSGGRVARLPDATAVAASPPDPTPSAPPARAAVPASTTTIPLASPTTSVAATAVPPVTARPSPEVRFEAAAGRVRYPWRDLGFEIVLETARPGVLGTTRTSPRRILLYVRDDESVDELAFVFAHEVGHAVDFTFGEPIRRRAWLAARGLDPDSAWFGCNDCDDLATPAGDFAESFAAWQVGGASLFSSRLGPFPDARQQAVLAAFASSSRPVS